MFIKETNVTRKSGRKVTYLQLVTSVWDTEKKVPRHKVLCSLGRKDKIDKVQLSNLIEKLSTYLDEPNATTENLLRIGSTKEFGVGYLVEAVWKSLKRDRFFQAEIKERRYEKPVHSAILGLVINRCQQPASKRSADQWLSEEVYFPQAKKLQLHHYYRGMDFLLDCESELELQLYDHYAKLYQQGPQMVFYDTTSSDFETDVSDSESLRQYGYSRDHRPDRKQIVIGLTVDKHGLPLASDTFTGNTLDVETVKTTVARLSHFGVNRCLFVSDSGMVSSENLKALSGAGLDTLVGTRMRQLKEVNEQVLTKRGRFVELGDGLGVKIVEMDDYRYIVVKNDKQARKDAAVRAEIVERLQVVLDKIATGTASLCDIQHPLMKRFVRIQKDGQVKLNATKVRADAIYDGKYVLRTTACVSHSEAVTAYKTLYQVEQSFRTIKTVLKIRPMYHHADHRIKSHVKLCVLAYFIARHVEIMTGESWDTIVRLFRPLRIVELITDAGVVHRRSQLSDEQKAILKALKLRYPKEIQKISLNT